jgi:heme/copper-type cytochrome/quinol oxidase subunit 3
MRCAAICPQNAIEAGQSWGLVLYLLLSVPLSVYFLSQLNILFPQIPVSGAGWIKSVLKFIFFYLTLFISYHIFYLLLRIPLVNRVFSYTTMTHLTSWGRYREKNTDLKKI